MPLTKLEIMEHRAAKLRKEIAAERRNSAKKNKADFDSKIVAAVRNEYAADPDFHRLTFLSDLRNLFSPKTTVAIEPQTPITEDAIVDETIADHTPPEYTGEEDTITDTTAAE